MTDLFDGEDPFTGPPADDELIRQAEERLGYRLPSSYSDVLRQRNGGCGSRYLISEWGYPDIGIVLFDMPSGGHDAVMLDYRECGVDGEPAVVYVDEDRVPRRVARDFGEFLRLLVAAGS